MAKRGPNTKAGKTKASLNATRHGIRSDVAVIDDIEDPKDWEWHRRGILESLNPEGVLEFVLADQIAFTLWKLLRVAAYQASQTRWHIDQAGRDLAVANAYRDGTLGKAPLVRPDSDKVYAHELLRVLPETDTLAKIMRYEAHPHRQYIQTLPELEAIQLRRQGGQSPLARLDISAPPAA